MSGLASGLKKVFKKVGTFVKKIAPFAIIAGAAYLTGGFGLIAAGSATAGTSAAFGTAAGTGATGLAGVGSWISSLFTGGATTTAGTVGAAVAGEAATTAGAAGAAGGLGGFLSTSGGGMMAGSLLSGAAQGYMANAQSEQENQYSIDAENRRKASYEGAGNAASFRGYQSNGLVPGVPPAPAPASVPTPSTARPAVTAPAPVAAPRWQYDPDTRKIVYS